VAGNVGLSLKEKRKRAIITARGLIVPMNLEAYYGNSVMRKRKESKRTPTTILQHDGQDFLI
jgi:hypothetical protein